MFEYFIPSSWYCLGYIRSFGLISRDISLKKDFEVSKVCIIPN